MSTLNGYVCETRQGDCLPAEPDCGRPASARRLIRRGGRRACRSERAFLVHRRIDVRTSIDAQRPGRWTGEMMGLPQVRWWRCCLLPRRLHRTLSGNDVRLS
jgi:hypothetical protein